MYFGEYFSAGDENVRRAIADADALGLANNFKPTAVYVVTWRRLSPTSVASESQPSVSSCGLIY